MKAVPSSLLPFLSLLVAATYAGPLKANPDESQSLVQRDNEFKLRCSNAQDVIAGDLLDPSRSSHPNPVPKSGSAEPWMEYLWCVPNTKTYIFFGIGQLTTLAPLPREYFVRDAFSYAIADLEYYLQGHPDGHIEAGKYQASSLNTNVDIYVQNSKGKMTYGILKSALAGLKDVVDAYMESNSKTMVFQISDGEYGEVGIGYVGFHTKGWREECVYDIVKEEGYSCSDVRDKKVIK